MRLSWKKDWLLSSGHARSKTPNKSSNESIKKKYSTPLEWTMRLCSDQRTPLFSAAYVYFCLVDDRSSTCSSLNRIAHINGTTVQVVRLAAGRYFEPFNKFFLLVQNAQLATFPCYVLALRSRFRFYGWRMFNCSILWSIKFFRFISRRKTVCKTLLCVYSRYWQHIKYF